MTYRGNYSIFLISLMDKYNIEYYCNAHANENVAEHYKFFFIESKLDSLRIATITPYRKSDISFKEVVKYILEYGK